MFLRDRRYGRVFRLTIEYETSPAAAALSGSGRAAGRDDGAPARRPA